MLLHCDLSWSHHWQPSSRQLGMHPCLGVCEITTEIAEVLLKDDDHSDVDDTMTLYRMLQPRYASTIAAFAQTCQACCVPVLRVLWRRQGGLENLLKTLPGDAWELGLPPDRHFVSILFAFSLNMSHIIPSQSLKRLVCASEWKRFDFYSSFIKRLYLDGDTMHWLPDVLLATYIRHTSGQSHFLPNLRHISWLPLRDHLMTTPVTLPRSLTTFHVEVDPFGDTNRRWIEAMLSYMPFMTPHLEIINLQSKAIVSSGVPLSIEPIIGIKTLHSIQCDLPISLRSAIQLVNLPKLHTLILQINEIEETPSQDPSPSSYTFPNIEVLSVSSPEFLDACYFPSLRRFESNDTLSRVSRCIAILQNHCKPDLLVSARIRFNPNPGSSLTNDFIQPLLAFRSLETAIMCGGAKYLVDDRALQQMAQAWRHLSFLGLGSFYSNIPQITLIGLVPIARNCPNLEYLFLTLDARDPPPLSWDQKPGGGCSNTKLSSVQFAKSPVARCQEVAAFLSSLFPSLRTIDCGRNTPEKELRSWKVVEDSLRVFSAVRSQERRDALRRMRLVN